MIYDDFIGRSMIDWNCGVTEPKTDGGPNSKKSPRSNNAAFIILTGERVRKGPGQASAHRRS